MQENHVTFTDTEEEIQSQSETDEVQPQDETDENEIPQEETEETKKKLKTANWRVKEYQRFLIQTLIFITVVYVLFAHIIGVTAPPNDDMSPRIDATDLLVYYRLDKEPQAQDILVFKKNDTRYVARVIAVGGDTVYVTDRYISVNGSHLSEPKIYYETFPLQGYVKYPITLAKDECFVLVDRRMGSEDSRYFGPVKYSEIEGTVITVMRRTNF